MNDGVPVKRRAGGTWISGGAAWNLARLAAVVIGVGLIGIPSAMAQRVSDETAKSVTIAANQKQEIAALAQAELPKLADADPETRSTARHVILEPLGVTGVSVAFRIEYSQQLLDGLKKLAADNKAGGAGGEPAALNAIRVMGELATGESLKSLKDILADPRPSVRRAAAFAYERTFRIAGAGNGAPAVADAQVMTALSELADRLKTEDEPLVIDGIVLALDAAINVGEVQQLAGVREQAVKLLAETVAARLKQTVPNDDTLDSAVARALDSLVRTQTDQQRKLSVAGNKSISLLAGHVLARVRVQLLQNLVGDRVRADLMVCLAERAYTFAHRSMGNQPLELGLCGMIAASNDGPYTKKVIELIGPSGMLTGAPFGFADDEFVKE